MRLEGLLHRFFACPFGKHERSRRHYHEEHGYDASQCRYCGTPMKRLPGMDWTVDHQTRPDTRHSSTSA